jgi:hypothetical protein
MVVSKKKRGRPRKKVLRTHLRSKRRYVEGLKEVGLKTYKINKKLKERFGRNAARSTIYKIKSDGKKSKEKE